ncbi:MAG: cell division protein ZapA [Elusimicrobia bacterium]|nr:cell division protein ZapA [Elusimicrobiota bacterium]
MIEEKIPVVIHGQTYEILGNSADTLYYHSLARYVEEKMKEIQQSTQIVSSQKIAVLAALNVADELFQERDTKSISVKSLEGKQQELIHILDKVLE